MNGGAAEGDEDDEEAEAGRAGHRGTGECRGRQGRAEPACTLRRGEGGVAGGVQLRELRCPRARPVRGGRGLAAYRGRVAAERPRS